VQEGFRHYRNNLAGTPPLEGAHHARGVDIWAAGVIEKRDDEVNNWE
jgi:hypothetical protein